MLTANSYHWGGLSTTFKKCAGSLKCKSQEHCANLGAFWLASKDLHGLNNDQAAHDCICSCNGMYDVASHSLQCMPFLHLEYLLHTSVM